MDKKEKYILFTITALIFNFTVVFAETDESYSIMSTILNSVLSTIAWLGFAIAIGALVFIGIKYAMSAANEKANLKGSFTKYLIGIGLIVFCSTIASAVANIANTTGENTAEGIVKRGLSSKNVVWNEPDSDEELLDAANREKIENNNDINGPDSWNPKGLDDKKFLTPEEMDKKFAEDLLDAVKDFVHKDDIDMEPSEYDPNDINTDEIHNDQIGEKKDPLSDQKDKLSDLAGEDTQEDIVYDTRDTGTLFVETDKRSNVKITVERKDGTTKDYESDSWKNGQETIKDVFAGAEITLEAPATTTDNQKTFVKWAVFDSEGNIVKEISRNPKCTINMPPSSEYGKKYTITAVYEYNDNVN